MTFSIQLFGMKIVVFWLKNPSVVCSCPFRKLGVCSLSTPRNRERNIPDRKVHGANMGPTWVLSARGEPHVGPMNLAVRDVYLCRKHCGCHWISTECQDICRHNDDQAWVHLTALENIKPVVRIGAWIYVISEWLASCIRVSSLRHWLSIIQYKLAGQILGLRPANGGRRYKVNPETALTRVLPWHARVHRCRCSRPGHNVPNGYMWPHSTARIIAVALKRTIWPNSK